MKNSGQYIAILALFAVLSLISCREDDPYKGNGESPVITAVYLEDGNSSVYDRLVDYARLGQTIRIEGRNLMGIVKVYINGYDSAFNQTLMSEGSMIVSINSRVPVKDVDTAVKDKIRVLKRNGLETTFDFIIRASAPAVTNVSHTMARAGEQITIAGTNLHGATEVLFPGDIAGTDISSDDEDGEWVKVTVPAGVTTSGSLKITGSNGSAFSAPYFNFREGMLHNFDDVSNASWASGVEAATQTDAILPATGVGPRSQGNYNLFNALGNLGNADQRYWLNSTTVGGIMSGALSATVSTDLCGIQMDIYVEGVWTSGLIRMTMVDGLGNTRGSMTWSPVYPEGVRTPAAFVNPGCWFTVTLPFSLGTEDFGGKTIGDVVTQMAGAAYKQCGPWLDNNGASLPDGVSVTAEEKIYFDNIRVVPLAVPAYSDYPEDEDEEEV